MFKKFVFLVIIISIFSLPSTIVFASHSPLGREGRASFVDPESSVTLVSYNANLRIRTGVTHASLTMALRNDSAEDIEFLMGMPTQYDEFSVVENLSIIVRRELLPFWIRRNIDPIPQRWYAWTIPLKAGETVVVDTTFSIGNKKAPNGVEVVTLPLSYLGAFRGAVENLKVIADLDFHGAYAFHPSPSVLPAEYARGGRLLFSLDGFDMPQNDLVIYYIPLISAVPDYIAANAADNPEVLALLQLFQDRDFETAVLSINTFIEANSAFPLRRELEFLKALAYAELGRFDEVNEIYERLEHRSGFSGDLANAVRQKIIYDRVLMLTLDKNQTEALQYLEDLALTDETDVFSLWLRDEIRRLTPPPPPPEPEPTPVEEVVVEEPVVEETPDFLPVSPEMIGILVFAAILIIYLIFRNKRKKRRKFYFSKG